MENQRLRALATTTWKLAQGTGYRAPTEGPWKGFFRHWALRSERNLDLFFSRHGVESPPTSPKMATYPATDTAECRQHPSAVLPFVGLPGASVAWIRPVACTGMPPRASVLTRDELDRKQGGPSGCTSVPCVWTATAASFAVNANCARTIPRLPSRPFPFRQQGRSCQPCQQNLLLFSMRETQAAPGQLFEAVPRLAVLAVPLFFLSLIDVLIYSSTCFIKLSLPSEHKLPRACCCGINLNPVPCRHHSSLLLIPSCVESAHLESCFLFPQAST